MADIRDYSTTAASNTDKFPEGMAPSAVNDGMRAVQADIAKLVKDTDGTLTLGGTATAYTLTLNTAPAALSDGLYFWATANTTNTGGATTLVVTPSGGSAFASKKIKVYQSGAEGDPTAGSIIAGNHYLFQYDSAADSGTGAFILANPSIDGLVLLGSGTASAAATLDLTVPSGYEEIEIVLMNVVPATAGAALYMRVSTNSGSSYDSGATSYAYAYRGLTAVAGSNDFGTTTTQLLLTGAMVSNTASPAFARIAIAQPKGTTTSKRVFVETAYTENSAANFCFLTGGGSYGGSSSALTNVRFYMSGGNITSLTYRIYGKRG